MPSSVALSNLRKLETLRNEIVRRLIIELLVDGVLTFIIDTVVFQIRRLPASHSMSINKSYLFI